MYYSPLNATGRPSEWRGELQYPPELFTGKDLLQLEVESFEASKESLRASTVTGTQNVDTESEGESSAASVSDADGDFASVAPFETANSIVNKSDDSVSGDVDKDFTTPDSANAGLKNKLTCICCSESIDGIRWKCSVCEEYTFCDACRSGGKVAKEHTAEHTVITVEIEAGKSMWHLYETNSVILSDI